jgi:hypothetical protein
MLRFAVLSHDHPAMHWDLLLQEGQVLRTWRLAHPPDTPGSIDAEPLPDHRLAYLDYEGPISGDRGQVTRWDRGEYVPLESSPHLLRLQIAGDRLQGIATLETTADSADWTFRLIADEDRRS